MNSSRLRVAVVSFGISHFEAPFYRLLSAREEFTVRVFFQVHPKRNRNFDTDYRTSVWWGEDVLAGYDNAFCPDTREVWPQVRAWKPDVILLYGYLWKAGIRVLFNARRSGIPVVFRGTLNPLIDARHPVRSRIMRAARIPLLRSFTAWQYGGEYAFCALRQAGVPAARCYKVPYAVDTPHFVTEADRQDRESARAAFGLSDELVVLFIGQLSWFKGPDIALESFRRFLRLNPRSVLLVVGDGRELPQLKAFVAENGLEGRVRFEGFCPSRETVKYYIASDIVLFTSRYETWARSVNEAMLCRRPCIVNDTMPVANDLVQSGSGFVVPRPEPDEYAAHLKRFSDMTPPERSRMGEAARERALDFCYERHMPAAVQSLVESIKR